MSAHRLQGRVALVTGGAVGIGRAIVQRLFDEGCTSVYVLDIVADPNTDTPFQGYHYLQVDVSDLEAVKTILQSIDREEERLDVLVNNAATFIYEAAEDVTEEALAKSFAVNVNAPTLMTRHAVPLLKKAQAGSVINMSSINALIANPGFVPYAMSKAAIVQLTRNSAVDLGKHNIRVNCILPGAILTEATSRHAKADGVTLEEMIEDLKQRHALPKMGRPEDIAAAVAFLASDDAAFITGSSLVVDGGYTIK